ncbi:MAG: hypothetical protein HP493_04665 [Nitrospira sp.]|nr:hypothetical protein [Nitrospira sp.]
MLEGIHFLDVTPYLVAILGLLVIWQYYQLQIMTGRILAVDIFDRSGIRMYIYVTPDDDSRCEVCARAHGRVFLPSQVAKNGFPPLDERCKGSIPCPGVLVGLYGAWLEARAVMERVRTNAKNGGIALSPEDLRALVNGQWEQSISADTDRLGIHMIEAVCYEKINQAVSIAGYRYVISEVKEVRHLLLLVPAYLRLSLLLVRSGATKDAREVIERFERRFPVKKRGPHFPTVEQRTAMKIRKTYLLESQPAQPMSVAV